MRIAIDTNGYRDFCEDDANARAVLQSADRILMPLPVLVELQASFACGTLARQDERVLSIFLRSPACRHTYARRTDHLPLWPPLCPAQEPRHPRSDKRFVDRRLGCPTPSYAPYARRPLQAPTPDLPCVTLRCFRDLRIARFINRPPVIPEGPNREVKGGGRARSSRSKDLQGNGLRHNMASACGLEVQFWGRNSALSRDQEVSCCGRLAPGLRVWGGACPEPGPSVRVQMATPRGSSPA